MAALQDHERRELRAFVLRHAGLLPKDADADFGAWLDIARPEFRWDYPHFRYMQDRLDRVTAGTLRRVVFSVAVRHGKTEHDSIGYGAYRIERDPATRILVTSYAQSQAFKLSREIRKLVKKRGVALSGVRDSVSEWETVGGGGVRAVGVGTGVASVNADLIIIDDPIGKRADAESAVVRDSIWDWLQSDILARVEPHTAIIYSMPRWHADDPIGRILDRQRDLWEVVDLPGEAEEDDPLGREPGDLLWPEMRGREWMDEMRASLGSYGFASLMQGRPRPREGGMFHWTWWRLSDSIPAVGPMVRYWDLAGTAPTGDGHDPDYTAGALLCRTEDRRTAIVDVARFRKSVGPRDVEIESIAREDLVRFPNRVTTWIETETGIAGKDRTADLVRRLQSAGMVVKTEHATGKKELRWEPLASKAEMGNVVLCPGEWRDPFRAEAADAPGGRHDDQLDAAAGADAKLAEVRAPAEPFLWRV